MGTDWEGEFNDKMDDAVEYIIRAIKEQDGWDGDAEEFESIFDMAMSDEGGEATIPIGQEVCRRLGKHYPW